MFKKQLMMYFLQNSSNFLNKEELNKFNYERYNIFIKDLDKDISNNEIKDFWSVFNLLLKKNELTKVLYIIDQYKEENDEKNFLNEIESIIFEHKTCSKLLVSNSINDAKTKIDFNNILKEMVNPGIIKKYYNDNVENDNEKEKSYKLFGSYDPSINYIDESLYEEKLFEKIKIFNEQENQNTDKPSTNVQEIWYSHDIKKNKKNMRIIYIY